jgi:DNA modification methylase
MCQKMAEGKGCWWDALKAGEIRQADAGKPTSGTGGGEVIITGDALTELKRLDAGIVQTCITSPPYWGLRNYGCDGQLGLEPTPEEYVERMVEIFREVRRVLRDDGTLWLVLGDSYTGATRSADKPPEPGHTRDDDGRVKTTARAEELRPSRIDGLKPKDLVGIPWRVAFALQADGWYLRSDIIWAKPNPMPESVTDRPTSAHEHIFLLAKSQRYFYDAEAVRETVAESTLTRVELAESRPEVEAEIKADLTDGYKRCDSARVSVDRYSDGRDHLVCKPNPSGRNKRNVWTVSTKPYPEAHFAVFPPDLIEPCVLAGSAEGDTVLDPFLGSGTTAEVALKHRREFIGIELNPEYVELAEKRLREVEVVMF